MSLTLQSSETALSVPSTGRITYKVHPVLNGIVTKSLDLENLHHCIILSVAKFMILSLIANFR